MNYRKLSRLKDAELIGALEDCLSEMWMNLPLQAFCHNGGYYEVNDVAASQLRRGDGEISCVATIDFTECAPTSCAERTHDVSRGCTLKFTVDSAGEYEFSDVAELWDGEERSSEQDDDDEGYVWPEGGVDRSSEF